MIKTFLLFMLFLLVCKSQQDFELRQAQIWLLLEQITKTLTLYFQSFSVICLSGANGRFSSRFTAVCIAY
jgi:hypothetical protein